MSHVTDLEALGWNSFFEDQWRALSLGERDGEKSSFAVHDVNEDRGIRREIEAPQPAPASCVPARVVGEERGIRREIEGPQPVPSSCVPARVVGEERELLRLQTDLHDAFWGQPTGRARRDHPHPAIGDWVACSRAPSDPRASIHAVLPRRSCLTRRAAGRPEQAQVLAANVDVGFVVTSLDSDFNPRRIERYVTMIWDGGVRPVVLLTKRDLCDDVSPMMHEIASVAPGVDVRALSAVTGVGMYALDADLRPGSTAVLLGSSGVGKSTLVNRLLGEHLVPTQPIRESDGRGRHTTTSRHLWVLPSGGLLIDSPGMRELQLWSDAESLDRTFADLGVLSSRCRFTDCRHRTEPGCEVKAAVERGAVSPERLASYDKLSRELAFQARKQDKAQASLERKRRKKVSRQAQDHARRKRSGE